MKGALDLEAKGGGRSPIEELFILRRFLAFLCLLPMLLAVAGCGPSKGQTIGLYLGSVTIHERRLQAWAEELENLAPRPGEASRDLTELREKVETLQQLVRDERTEVSKLHVPELCEDLHKMYDRAFDLTARRLGLLAAFLGEVEKNRKGILPDPALGQVLQTTQSEMAELANAAGKVDEEIRQAKLGLARRFPEVQVPEADPPAQAPSP